MIVKIFFFIYLILTVLAAMALPGMIDKPRQFNKTDRACCFCLNCLMTAIFTVIYVLGAVETNYPELTHYFLIYLIVLNSVGALSCLIPAKNDVKTSNFTSVILGIFVHVTTAFLIAFCFFL